MEGYGGGNGQVTQDQELIARVRPLLSRRKGFSQKKMFGGVCFMIHGNMCVGTWKGSLVVRLHRDHHEETLSEPHTRPFDITGKVMKGWALIEPAGIGADDDLKSWVRRAAKFAGSLPGK